VSTHPAGAGRVIAREHRARHAPRIPREGVVFREPPDMAGGPVFSALSASRSRNHSARRQGKLHVKGHAAPETKAAAERARLLIDQAEALGEPIEDPLLLFSLLYGFWTASYIHSMGTRCASFRRSS
jgi:hypothetical protein